MIKPLECLITFCWLTLQMTRMLRRDLLPAGKWAYPSRTPGSFSLPVDGYCQRSGHPSVKPFSTLKREGSVVVCGGSQGWKEVEKDGGGWGGETSDSRLMIQKQRSHRVGERKMSQATYRPCRCLLAYHKGTIKPSQCKAHTLQINSSAAALDLVCTAVIKPCPQLYLTDSMNSLITF